MGIHGGRRWKRRRRRLHGASGGARLDGELQGGGAELLRVSGRRGETGGHGNGERRQRWRSGLQGGERTRGGGRNERVRGRSGLRGVVRGVPGDEEEAGGGQGSRRWRRGGARASARAVPLSGRKTTEEGPGGLGRLLAGPACCGWAAQGKPQVSPSFFYFCFSIFFLTFVWFNKNTKPFYFIMPIFVGANGIIPELFYKWHNFWAIFHIYRNIFPMQIIIELIQMAKINIHELLKILF